MKSVIIVLLLAVSSAVSAAPDKLTPLDCQLMGLDAAMWSVNAGLDGPPNKLVNQMYTDYDQLVQANHISKGRAFELMGLFLRAKSYADTNPTVAPLKLAKTVELSCLATIGKKM